MNIKILTTESGDWQTLVVDGNTYFEGHKIPEYLYLELLEKSGNTVEDICIPDEEY